MCEVSAGSPLEKRTLENLFKECSKLFCVDLPSHSVIICSSEQNSESKLMFLDRIDEQKLVLSLKSRCHWRRIYVFTVCGFVLNCSKRTKSPTKPKNPFRFGALCVR